MNEADEIFADATRAVETVMQQLVEDVAVDLAQAISIPVGRDSRGRVVVRSLPGEYPRLETGRLKASIEHVVFHVGATMVVGVVQTNTPYDVFLVRIRPYRDYIESKWARLAEQRFAITLR